MLEKLCHYCKFKDAIREGDGGRVLRVWKFLSRHQIRPTTALKHSTSWHNIIYCYILG